MAGQPPVPFVYRDLGNMAIVGRGSAVADLGWLHLTGFTGWLAWLFLHLLKLIGLPQPAGGADRVGRRLSDVPAQCAADYERGSASFVTVSSDCPHYRLPQRAQDARRAPAVRAGARWQV